MMFTTTIGSAIISPEGVSIMDFDKYMSVEQAEKVWNITGGWIRKLCRDGKLKCIRIANAWFIEKDQPNPKKRE
jgi:hypothetical protein